MADLMYVFHHSIVGLIYVLITQMFCLIYIDLCGFRYRKLLQKNNGLSEWFCEVSKGMSRFLKEIANFVWGITHEF